MKSGGGLGTLVLIGLAAMVAYSQFGGIGMIVVGVAVLLLNK